MQEGSAKHNHGQVMTEKIATDFVAMFLTQVIAESGVYKDADTFDAIGNQILGQAMAKSSLGENLKNSLLPQILHHQEVGNELL